MLTGDDRARLVASLGSGNPFVWPDVQSSQVHNVVAAASGWGTGWLCGGGGGQVPAWVVAGSGGMLTRHPSPPVALSSTSPTALQMKDKPEGRQEAAKYRERLLSFLQASGQRLPEDTCAVCLEKMAATQPSAPGKELIMLACLHTFHDECWGKHVAGKQAGGAGAGQDGAQALTVSCPTCRQPVQLFD